VRPAAQVAAACSGGLLYALPFVRPELAPLAFVGMAPALFALATGAPGLGSTLGLSFVAAATGAVIIGLPLLAISTVALVIQAGMMFGWPLAALGLFAVLRRRTGWPIGLLWPCCWVLCEWSWSFHSVGQISFGLSGYTQFVYPRLIQFAELTGVLGVSFLVQAVVGSLAEAAIAWWSAPVGARGHALRAPRVRIPALACAAGVLLALGWGTMRLRDTEETFGPRLALVQPAVLHDLTDASLARAQDRQLLLARVHVRPGDVDLVVFPENAVAKLIEGTPFLDQFREVSRQLKAPVLAGVWTRLEEDLKRLRDGLPEYRFYAGGRAFSRGYTSAALIDGGGIVAKYDKVHLLPFTEVLPAQELATRLGLLDRYRELFVSILGYVGTGVPAEKITLLRAPGLADVPFWTPLCFELADARLAREAARQGARLFLNLTSEGDLGPQIYWNTMAISVLRAIELRTGVARCGNMGISGTIDPWGRQRHHLRGRRGALWGEPGVLKTRAPLGTGRPTFYARFGDWPVAGCAGVLIAACVTAVARKRDG
jgi:apolipoprotein N-acyltransferase